MEAADTGAGAGTNRAPLTEPAWGAIEADGSVSMAPHYAGDLEEPAVGGQSKGYPKSVSYSAHSIGRKKPRWIPRGTRSWEREIQDV